MNAVVAKVYAFVKEKHDSLKRNERGDLMERFIYIGFIGVIIALLYWFLRDTFLVEFQNKVMNWIRTS